MAPRRQPPAPPPDLGLLLNAGIPRERAMFRARLGELRFKRGWNWQELGEAAGLSGTHVKYLEQGRRTPELATLFKLVRGLKLCSIDQLLGPLPTEDVLR